MVRTKAVFSVCILCLGIVANLTITQQPVMAEGISFQDPSSFGQRGYRPRSFTKIVDLMWQGETHPWRGLVSPRGLEEALGDPFIVLEADSSLSTIDQILKNFMTENAHLFGVQADSVAQDFQVSRERTRFSGPHKYVTYNRCLEMGSEMIPIDGLYITFRFKYDRLVGFSTSGLQFSEDDLRLDLSIEDAIQIVKDDSGYRKGSDVFQTKTRLSVKWFSDSDGAVIVRPVYLIELTKASVPGIFHFEVNAQTGDIVEISSNLHLGHAAGDFFERLPGDLTRKGLPAVTVKSGGQSELSASDGSFTLEGPDLLCELQNSGVRVMDATGSVSTLRSRGSSEMVFDAPHYLADVMSFIHVGRINTFVKSRLRSIPMSDGRGDFLTRPITVNTVPTNGTIKTCNAWYDPQKRSLNFLPASNECENSAYISDIVYHEWGHALDDALGGIKDRAFSEGIGDIMATLMTGDYRLAPGFIKTRPEGLRDLRMLKVFPRDRDQNPHLEGLIIGGAWFEVMKLMEGRYGPEQGRSKTADIFLKHLISAENYLESYQAALVVDDNDGNLTNGTPHYCFFNQAFSKRGLIEADAKCRR